MISSQSFSDNSIDGLKMFLSSNGRADHFIMSSWYHYPKNSIPDGILTNEPTMMSVFRNMDQTLNYFGLENRKNCFYDSRRTFDGRNHDITFRGYQGSGNMSGIVFRAYCDNDGTMKPIYNCKHNGYTFVSNKYDCEGKTPTNPHFIGYVSRHKAAESPKTIYRCRSNSENHFVTTSLAECSRNIYGGILGYTK